MNDMRIDARRIREITTSAYLPVEEPLQFKSDGKCIVYWMSRDQRIQDNWALLTALHEAAKRKVNVMIAFTLVPRFLDATIRQFDFMLKGISEAQKTAHSLGIPFHFFLEKDPAKAIVTFANSVKAGVIS